MGQLHDHGRWAQRLPPEVVEALEEWVTGKTFSLRWRDWFNDGRSGEPVAKAVREHDAGGADQRVLKFFKAGGKPRVANIHQARSEAPHGFRERIAVVEEDPVHLGEWNAVFLLIAGGNLDSSEQLSNFFDKDEFPGYCHTIVGSVLQDWNENRVSRRKAQVGYVLEEIMGRRRADVLSWGRRSGLLDDYRLLALQGWRERLPNPFTLVTGAEQGMNIEDLLTGKAHGDLHGRNVLIPTVSRVKAKSYVLIDCDRYSDRAPLTRDPMHLLVDLILDRFDKFEDQQTDVAKLLVAPNASSGPRSLKHVQDLSIAIHTPPPSSQIEESWGTEWNRQCLLSLVGVGLLHLGRDLRTREPEKAKEWCLQLAALAASAYLRSNQPRHRITHTSMPTVSGRDGVPRLVDRDGERRGLWRMLTSGSGGVLTLRGARGVGKTALVKNVLSDLSEETADWAPSRVHAHDLHPAASFDVKTLADFVAGSPEDTAHRWHPGSSLVRLEAELRRLGESQVIVSIDSAENLLDSDSELVAPDIDDALDMLATERDHRVTVLLVTRRDLYSSANRSWEAQSSNDLKNLPDDWFSEYFSGLDGHGRTDLGELSNESRRELYEKLQGNPRLAELAYAVISAPNSTVDLYGLAARLRDQDSGNVSDFLTNLIVAGVSKEQRRVLEALAAFDTPVPETAVAGLLDDVSPTTVGAALLALTTSRVVHDLSSGQQRQFYIPPDDAHLILKDMGKAAYKRLHHLAADQLTFLKTKHPRHQADLRMHFAELRALLEAGKAPAAYNMIELIDDVVREWNSRHLLLKERKAVRGRLRDRHLEMANWNAIGSIYSSSCDFRKFRPASDAFGKALAIANAIDDGFARMRIHGNLAAMYWEHNDTQKALSYFELARDEALRLHDPMVRMGALEGIADCNRRHGDYAQAISNAENAFAVPELADYPDTPSAENFATSRQVAIGLKLARWFAELGKAEKAARFLELAEEAAADRPDEWLRASIQDGRADLEFYRGDLDLAKEAAMAAEDDALRLRDPITLLQARTTLCLVHLKKNDTRSARLAIERAQYHRRQYRSLVVLALHALTDRHRDRSAASNRFTHLYTEASARTKHDEHDFSAWDFQGIALCGLAMDKGKRLDEAVAAFRKARSLTPRTPGLINGIRFIVEKLDETGRTPNQLSSITAVLDQ